MNVILSLISSFTNIVACASADTTSISEKLRPLGKYDLERLRSAYTHLLVKYSNEKKAFCRFSGFLSEHYVYVRRIDVEDPNSVDVKITAIEEATQRFKENNTKKLQKCEEGSKMYVKIEKLRVKILEGFSKNLSAYRKIKAWMERHPNGDKRKADVEKAKRFYEKLKEMEYELENTHSHINLIEYSLRKLRKRIRKRIKEANQEMESTDM